MRKLILIKHARPLVDPTKSSELWPLSDEGREQAKALAAKIREYQPAVVVSSEEAKANETAQILAKELQIAHETAADLHEHDRSNVPHMRSGEFISHVEVFFRRPEERVLGRESATQALGRIENAIDDILAKHADGNIAIVSHGTVIALFVEAHSDRKGFAVWREMSLPSFAVFELPEMELLDVRDRL
jgi:broad specificity phosphatase PhoE